jgi:hypothetical protein
MACIEAGRQHLDQNIAGQADRKTGQRLRGKMGVGSGVAAIAEQRGGNRLPTEHQPHRGRQSQQQRQFHATVLRVHRARLIARAQQAADRGQQHRAQRNADQPERQLVQRSAI